MRMSAVARLVVPPRCEAPARRRGEGRASRRLLVAGGGLGAAWGAWGGGRQRQARAEDGDEGAAPAIDEATPAPVVEDAPAVPLAEEAAAPTPAPAVTATPASSGSVFVYPEDQPDNEPVAARLESSGATLSPSDAQLLEYNRRIQQLNNVPSGFPSFIRAGFEVRVLAPGAGWELSPEGLLYQRITDVPPDPDTNTAKRGVAAADGQEVTFHYVAYNESGRTIDSTYRRNDPARTRLGVGSGMIPGFEVALRLMSVGDRFRLVVPPALGPPVGPSTFFSAKQYEVFDVEVLDVKSCTRKAMGMVSNVVCE